MAAAPWRELTDRNPVLLAHPNTRHDALAVVMGHWQKEYRVALYLGDDGKNEYHRTVLRLSPVHNPCCATIAATTGD